jgi:ribosomal protein L24
MKIKKGDEVVIIAGKDKGATGKVIAVDRVRDRITVEGANLMKKNTKVDAQGKGGGVITTEAVLCPTPGKASSSSNVRGNLPPCCSTRMRERFQMFLAFIGASPTVRMIFRISGMPSLTMASGVGARLNNSGVTLFTDLSVVCAGISTARQSV